MTVNQRFKILRVILAVAMIIHGVRLQLVAMIPAAGSHNMKRCTPALKPYPCFSGIPGNHLRTGIPRTHQTNLM
jgi:hypothetical protein